MSDPYIEKVVAEAVASIVALDTSDPNTIFSTREGPCRYSRCEDPRIRQAKADKIAAAPVPRVRR